MKLAEVEAPTKTPAKVPEKQKQEFPLYVPGGFTVIVYNDHVTPAEVAAEAISHGTGMPLELAYERMFKAHNQGIVDVAAYGSKDVAESVANKIEQHARGNQRYDHYRAHVKHQGPWPLKTDVMDSHG